VVPSFDGKPLAINEDKDKKLYRPLELFFKDHLQQCILSRMKGKGDPIPDDIDSDPDETQVPSEPMSTALGKKPDTVTAEPPTGTRPEPSVTRQIPKPLPETKGNPLTQVPVVKVQTPSKVEGAH
jgi:hypothetical protein